mmetsp:Transcript_51177/g.118952  ORF Transcript_51177/g.118952 Transcript_51177/m.118952 type:complete len:237 (+) Transcript_51177:486-1196(+)
MPSTTESMESMVSSRSKLAMRQTSHSSSWTPRQGSRSGWRNRSSHSSIWTSTRMMRIGSTSSWRSLRTSGSLRTPSSNRFTRTARPNSCPAQWAMAGTIPKTQRRSRFSRRTVRSRSSLRTSKSSTSPWDAPPGTTHGTSCSWLAPRCFVRKPWAAQRMARTRPSARWTPPLHQLWRPLPLLPYLTARTACSRSSLGAFQSSGSNGASHSGDQQSEDSAGRGRRQWLWYWACWCFW